MRVRKLPPDERANNFDDIFVKESERGIGVFQAVFDKQAGVIFVHELGFDNAGCNRPIREEIHSQHCLFVGNLDLSRFACATRKSDD
jgi:hypothetical protein